LSYYTLTLSERDLPEMNVELNVPTHHSLTHPYHSTLSNDQSHCTVGVFRWAAREKNIFFPTLAIWFYFFPHIHSVHCCYFKQLLILVESVACTHMSKLRRRHITFLHTQEGVGKRRKKNPKNHFLFPFTWRIFVIIPYFLRPLTLHTLLLSHSFLHNILCHIIREVEKSSS
jgi:hypothetical protein